MKYLASENVWLSKNVYEDAETAYYEKLSKESLTPLAQEVAKARQKLIKCRDTFSDDFASASSAGNIDTGAFKFIEKKIVDFEKSLDQVFEQLKSLALRVSAVEKLSSSSQSVHEINLNQQPQINPEASKADDDDDVDLFASDSEEESNEASKIREERLAAYAAKKSKKPALIAKSNIILDVKPWDDETDLKLMESSVRKIELDGLLWGASKLVPLAYGIKKLQISCVVEDDKVSIDWLTEQIEAIEELVQSVDIAAFNKI
ncbi:probable elongation factor 1-delta isoform X1 [Dendroctonus ponderosae]|uniref:Translation elongation factor EF1B beta/delta subunit guanine nucleotide exchange domain-containing protein n=1 Tax=Dendroctonus ponderosae TaxID=77166 RepID=A0AAR5PH54_DENPD|nr:probable elongation factor 1-delta isoform X1 [Dendroctonus ponderosae]